MGSCLSFKKNKKINDEFMNKSFYDSSNQGVIVICSESLTLSKPSINKLIYEHSLSGQQQESEDNIDKFIRYVNEDY